MPVDAPDRSSVSPQATEVAEKADGRRVRGDRTKRAILDRAVQIASEEGLEGLSIGRLAGDLGVSKSGLFAHFGSKTDLQLATIDVAREIFIQEVIWGSRPDPGAGGLLSLTDSWLSYMEREVFRGGCFFIAASTEFDSRPGPVRDRVASMMGEWLLALEAAIQDAQDAGELPAVVDSEQLAFEINSIGMGANWSFQLYHDETAFERAREAIRQRVSAGAPQKRGSRRAPVRPGVDEGAARRALRNQIAKLERELAALFANASASRDRVAGLLSRWSARARRR